MTRIPVIPECPGAEPAARRAAPCEVTTHAFWRHARFGLLAARRGDRIVAAPHRLALVEMMVHGPAWLQRRASHAIAAMDAALPPERPDAEPPVQLMEPAPPLPLAPSPFDPIATWAAWLRLFW